MGALYPPIGGVLLEAPLSGVRKGRLMLGCARPAPARLWPLVPQDDGVRNNKRQAWEEGG